MVDIGLFGGTFDPIHLGHLKTVQEVKSGFRLHTIYLVPAAQPPHKTGRAIAPPADRMAMLEIATRDLSGWEISATELNRTGLSYSVETVDEFKQRFADKAKLYFILGLDAFIEIHTWKAYQQLFKRVAFIVMTRPAASSPAPAARKTLQDFLDGRISDGYVFDSANGLFRHPDLQPVHLFATTPVHISSTEIRDKIGRGQPYAHLLPKGIAAYIQTKGLYQ